uniref:Uncharacterized protein n=1 Tax=Arion vulgaris TaxID=1028688 RepID=A0A0B7B749_9EUPU
MLNVMTDSSFTLQSDLISVKSSNMWPMFFHVSELARQSYLPKHHWKIDQMVHRTSTFGSLNSVQYQKPTNLYLSNMNAPL